MANLLSDFKCSVILDDIVLYAVSHISWSLGLTQLSTNQRFLTAVPVGHSISCLGPQFSDRRSLYSDASELSLSAYVSLDFIVCANCVLNITTMSRPEGVAKLLSLG